MFLILYQCKPNVLPQQESWRSCSVFPEPRGRRGCPETDRSMRLPPQDWALCSRSQCLLLTLSRHILRVGRCAAAPKHEQLQRSQRCPVQATFSHVPSVIYLVVCVSNVFGYVTKTQQSLSVTFSLDRITTLTYSAKQLHI